MSDIRKLVDNVHEFLSRASKDYGRIKEQEFSQDIFCRLVEGEIKSPIEDMFFIACHVLCSTTFVEINPGPFCNSKHELCLGVGLFLSPQARIGKYKVDFLLASNRVASKNFDPVVVELDGHDFHDKDKAQRAYEKGRDRFLVKSGYKVLHFTGSEVVADPYKVAYESLQLVGVFDESEEYNPANPFGIE